MIRAAALVGLILAAPSGAAAHQLIVFASTDCEMLLVEAKFTSGRVVQQAEVRILDGNNTLLTTQPITQDGTLSVALDQLDSASGLLVEVDTGSHDNYWIVTPDDIAKSCGS